MKLRRKLVKRKPPKRARKLAKRLAKLCRRRVEDAAAAINAYNVPTHTALMMREMLDSMLRSQLAQVEAYSRDCGFFAGRLWRGDETFSIRRPTRFVGP